MTSGSEDSAVSCRNELAVWFDLERDLRLASSLDERRAVASRARLDIAVHPEVHPVQTRVLLQAWRWMHTVRLPDWTAHSLPVASQLAWARLTLLVEPASLSCSLPWAALLEGLDLLESPVVLPVFRTLLGVADSSAFEAVRNALPRAIDEGIVSVSDARTLWLALLDDPSPSRRAQGWRGLALAESLDFVLPRARLEAALGSTDGAEVVAAIDAAGQRGHWKDIARCLEGSSPIVRKRAVYWASRLGDRESVSTLLALALDDVEAIGAEVIDALVRLHHRGWFVQPEASADLLELLHRGAPHEASSIAGLLFVARREVVSWLERLDASDPDWLYLVPIVAGLLRLPRPPHGLIDLLLGVAASSQRPAVVRRSFEALRDLVVDELLDVENNADVADRIEQIALARIDEYPEISLALITPVLSSRGAAILRERVGLDADASDRAAPAMWAALALPVVWRALDIDQRASLLERIDLDRWPVGAVESLSMRSPIERRIRRLARGVEHVEAATIALCDAAEPEDLSDVSIALLRVAESIASVPPRSLARSRLIDEGQRVTDLRGGEDTHQLPRSITDAVLAMESRWRARMISRPVCLHASANRLLPSMLLRMLDDTTESSSGTQAVLWRTLLSFDHPRTAIVAQSMLRHADADVQKLALRCLARRGASWIQYELERGLAGRDDRIVRACLEAIVSDGDTWAEPACLRALDHPNMNVKKIAAEALGRFATEASAPSLLRWLGQHDNPGFRDALRAALKRSLGTRELAAIVTAIETSIDEPRRVKLLVLAASGLVSIRFVRSLAMRRAAWVTALLAAIYDGSVHLDRGSIVELAPELQAVGLDVCRARQPVGRDPLLEAVEGIVFEGVSPERVERVLSTPSLTQSLSTDAHLVNLLRQRHESWIHWLLSRDDLRVIPVLRAVLDRQPTAVEQRRMVDAFSSWIALFERVDGEGKTRVFGLFEKLVSLVDPLSAIELGGALRVSLSKMIGLDRSPIDLLLRCGLTLTRDDVDRALASVCNVADPAAIRIEIVRVAFGLTRALSPVSQDESDALSSAVREGARSIASLRAGWQNDDLTLSSLARELPTSPRETWPALLDWMESIRPIGANNWPVTRRHRPEPSQSRSCQAGCVTHVYRLDVIATWLRTRRSQDDSEIVRLLALVSAGFKHWLEPLSFDEVKAFAVDESSLNRIVPLLGQAATCTPWFFTQRAWLQEQRRLGSPALQERLDALLAAPSRISHRLSMTPHDSDTMWRRLCALWVRVNSSTPFSLDDPKRWRSDLLDRDAEVVRSALNHLSQSPPHDWPEILFQMARDERARVRVHALRLARKTLAESQYREVAAGFLEDPVPELRRMAIRILAQRPSDDIIVALVARLADPVEWVRAEAREVVERLGERAYSALRRAHDQTRPDVARRFFNLDSKSWAT